MRSRLRLFDLLIRLYPRSYRERYRTEMEAFHAQERAAGARGAGYAVGLTWDHVRAAGAVWWREGGMMTRAMMDDLRQGIRSLRHAPGFTAFAVLTLALGIGATTAVFTVVERVLLRPLPYPDSERMVLVGTALRHDPDTRGPLSETVAFGLMEDPGPAEAVVATAERRVVVRGQGDPERAVASEVSTGFFEMFGVRAAAGRLLDPGDFEPGAPYVVVLGHGYWTDRFGADPEVVGRTLSMDGRPRTIVGVTEPGFPVPPEIDVADGLWIPLRPEDGRGSGSFYLTGVARLRAGASLDDFGAHADRVIGEAYPPDNGPSFITGGVVREYRAEVLGEIGSTLGRVLAAVALLLVIACVNVAGLLLTRGAQRGPELSVRAALGAGRTRLVRQLLSESMLLAIAGGAVGAALAWGAVTVLRPYAPGGMPRLAELAVDGRGLAFSLALALVTVVVFGLLPAFRSAARGAGGPDSHRRATAGPREGRLRAGLIALETALAVVLAVGSALLAHDLIRMASRDPGFRPEGLASVRLDLSPRYERDQWTDVWERLLEGAAALPGVTSAAVAVQVPYTGDRMASAFRPEGTEQTHPEGAFVIVIPVAGDYLRTLGATLLEGRTFEPMDGEGEPVALVNEAFVRAFWPGEPGAGKRVRSGAPGIEDEPEYRVVGVVADMVTRPGREPDPRIFLPLGRQPWRDMEIVVRTAGDAGAMAPPLRDLVRRFDPDLPVTEVRTVAALGSEALARPRFYTVLFGGFAMIALILAVVGVYGTTSFVTRGRTREIGIRLALGARASEVIRAVVIRAASAVGLGVIVGLGAAALGARLMEGILSDVAPREPGAYVVVALVVSTAAVTAAWLPASRAGRVDPSRTLREEG